MGFAPIIIWSIALVFFVAMVGYYSLKRAQGEYQQAMDTWRQLKAKSRHQTLVKVLDATHSIEQMQESLKRFFDESGTSALDEEIKALILARKQLLIAERRYHYYRTHHPSKAIAKLLGV